MPLAGKPVSRYQPYRQHPGWRSPRAIVKPPLYQFVLLSMLLHALAITLFGAPSGGSREGRALWGSLQVVLQGAPPEVGPTLKLDRGDRLSAPTLRSRPSAEPATPRERVEPVVPPRPEPVPVEAPFSMPPLLDRIIKPDRKLDPLPPLKVPPPTQLQSVRPITPVTPPAPRPAPAEAPVAEERPAPRVERVPAEAPLLPAPLVQPLPVPLPERLATPPPAERAPVETLAVPATPSMPPVERAPVEVPAIPVPSLESVTPIHSDAAPRPVEKAPVQEIPVSPQPPSAAERAQPRVQEREAPAKFERELPASVEPALRPSPLHLPELVRPREDEPSTIYDPTAPSLDPDALRKRAASIAREGTGRRAVLPFPMPPVPERKTKEQIAIEKARKPDCRTAYQELGLAAIVPLIANEFGEGNCRW